MDGLDFVIEHHPAQTGISAEEERPVHDLIRTGEVADDPKSLRAILLELHEGRLAEEVAAKKHAVADFPPVEVLGQLRMRERRRGFHPEHEAEPAGIAAGTGVVPAES